MLTKRQIDIILYLGRKHRYSYVAKICKDCGISYPHGYKLVNALEDIGIIEHSKTKNKKSIVLTPSGYDVYQSTERIKEICEKK